MNLFRKMRAGAVEWALSPLLGKGGQCGERNLSTREVWLEKTLLEVPAGSRILDAGAGELQYKRLCDHLKYVSQDFGEYDGSGDGEGLQPGNWDQSKVDIISDITNIPVEDASFDVVMCVEVLEHLPDPVAGMRELLRILRPGGKMLITAPFCALTHLAPYFFQTGYSRYFYNHWLHELGCEIEDMQWNGNYFEYLAQELRRLPSAGRTYANGALGWMESKALEIVLGVLNRFSECDKGSDQLLCYGLHVRARKR